MQCLPNFLGLVTIQHTASHWHPGTDCRDPPASSKLELLEQWTRICDKGSAGPLCGAYWTGDLGQASQTCKKHWTILNNKTKTGQTMQNKFKHPTKKSQYMQKQLSKKCMTQMRLWEADGTITQHTQKHKSRELMEQGFCRSCSICSVFFKWGMDTWKNRTKPDKIRQKIRTNKRLQIRNKNINKQRETKWWTTSEPANKIK